nr:hypothetical protein [uncultured Capnocytophaga sp.]
MKRILAFLVLGLLLGSCSDKLSSSKAEKLIQESLGKEPIYGDIQIQIGDNIEFFGYTVKEELESYRKLKEEGMIEMNERKNEYRRATVYSIHLTDKGKQYLLKEEKYNERVFVTIKTYSAIFNGIEEVHLIPEQNSARVLVSFKIEKTPFFILENLENQETLKDDSVRRVLKFRKLEEKGWKMNNINNYDIEH